MKKKVLFVAALFIGATTFAQDGLTSKKGEAILPEAGDWAIGFDANPFLNYFGNMFSGYTGQNTLSGATWNSNSNAILNNNNTMALTGKYFKDETTAYRGKVRIGLGGDSQTNLQDTATGSTLPGTGAIENKISNSNGFSFVVGAGLEKRKGSTRLQGYYGADFLFGLIGGGSTTYEYGATMDSLNVQFRGIVPGSRNTEEKNGNTMALGLNGFIGVEYFVAPKISIGAEYGYGFSMSSTGANETSTERWNAADQKLETFTTTGSKTSDWSFDTGVSGANLNITFHF
ncbi:MAG: hypothetical protein J5I47_04155 [Vicingus serpentipes]|nr:hypothetical protein [Vicingus serpentipes]